MAEYKCIKSFSVPYFDDDGEETDEYINVEEGTVWHTSKDRFIDSDVKLENNDLEWLELSTEILKQHFERVR